VLVLPAPETCWALTGEAKRRESQPRQRRVPRRCRRRQELVKGLDILIIFLVIQIAHFERKKLMDKNPFSDQTHNNFELKKPPSF
jgi:hypothetical protein